MNKNKLFLFAVTAMLLINSTAFGQNIRGFYLSNIGSWLGNATKETEILQYTQGNGFNYINFYDLGSVNWTSAADKNALASFMSRARTQYGVIQFGAVVEVYSFVTNYILPYNNSRTNANEKFDVLNMEFEFWVNSSISSSYCSKFLSPNGYSCDTAGAWAFAWKQFKQIDSTCAALGLISEVYLGWPNRGQMQQLASRADRILLHAYRPTDGDIYAYSRNRLIDLASINTVKKVISLFSSEPAFMGPWLNSNPITKPYQTYSSNLAAETATFKQYIDLQGYHWFTYEHMPQTILATATISASGPLTFCSGGSVSLTANSGSAYLWSPGGQTTQSITVTAAGAYSVRVTNSSGVNISSSPVNVTLSTTGVTPTVTASGPTSFCPGGSVTLTSSQSGSYHWSNAATTQSITVSASGNYSVTTSNGSCVATSTVIVVNAAASPVIPTVTANGATAVCPGGSVTLTSSQATIYNWSNGATTRSIVVNAAGNYSVTTGTGACSGTSTIINVTAATPTPTPTINASGATSFCPGGSVVLTSSVAGSYLWSNGATTAAITVTTSGNYSVTTGGASCPATSSLVVVNANSSPAQPTVTANGPLSICDGTLLTLTSSAAGGYLWSNGATTQSIVVSASGNYTVNAYSGPNCFSTSAVNAVVVFPAPQVPVITPGGSTVLSASNPSVTLSSSTAEVYLWSTGQSLQTITISVPGSFTVVTTDINGCQAVSVPVNVTSNSCIPPSIPTITLNGPNTIASGQTVTLTSSIGGGYLWSNGETTQSIIVSTPGFYTVNVYNSSTCYSTSLPVEITQMSSVGINEPVNGSEIIFHVYPNPARDLFNLDFNLASKQNLILKLIDVTGREIQSREIKGLFGENHVLVDVAAISRGVYFACLVSEDQKQMIKVVVE